MSLLRAADLHLAFGARTLFSGLTLAIDEGERVGLVGVNGSGKSTLMRILAGVAKPDSGLLQLQRGARITYLPQEPEFPEGATVASELAVAQAPLRDALAEHAALSARLASSAEKQEQLLARMAQLADAIERFGGWDTEHHAKELLDRLGVHAWDAAVSALSGGERKRVAIARALLSRPDLLLLDEPTNHLDADTVEWLEEELDSLEGALLLVTHDRYFLDELVDRIVEIQPGEGVTSYPGNYEAYLEQKLEAEEQAQLSEHKRQRWIAQEVAWLRKRPEARRTKSKARIDRARRLMAERGFSRAKVADLQLAVAPRLGGTVLEARKVSKAFDGRKVLDGVELIVQRGERIGLVGPNGVGKTTLLRVLLGELSADSGEVVVGTATRIAYYDQHRSTLDPEQTVYDAASHGEDWIELSGRRIHLRDYLDDLLFPYPMQQMQVKALSGGERNRLLLARLFLEGANVLVLDEPTNDLDIVTLNVLERLLLAFAGSVLLVTHDRYFLDKVATSILAFEGGGKVVRYEGNYDMYRRLRDQVRAAAPEPPRPAPPPAAEAPSPKKGRLSYLEQRELDGMESAIEAAEAKKRELETLLADPGTYARKGVDVAGLNAQLEAAGHEVDRLYQRWDELSAKLK